MFSPILGDIIVFRVAACMMHDLVMYLIIEKNKLSMFSASLCLPAVNYNWSSFKI